VIAAFGLALAPGSERPDILIEREGATAALRSASGNLVFPPATAAGYSVDNWLLADGDDRDAAAAAAGEGVFHCDLLGCIGAVKGKTVALIRHEGALEEDCRLADIVIAPFTVGKKCRAARVIVDRRVLKAAGAHALYIEGLSIRTETVAASRGHRPWVPDRGIAPPPRSPFSTGHAYAHDEKAEDGDEGEGAERFDGNPEK
jgi:competence protein ComEC